MDDQVAETLDSNSVGRLTRLSFAIAYSLPRPAVSHAPEVHKSAIREWPKLPNGCRHCERRYMKWTAIEETKGCGIRVGKVGSGFLNALGGRD